MATLLPRSSVVVRITAGRTSCVVTAMVLPRSLVVVRVTVTLTEAVTSDSTSLVWTTVLPAVLVVVTSTGMRTGRDEGVEAAVTVGVSAAGEDCCVFSGGGWLDGWGVDAGALLCGRSGVWLGVWLGSAGVVPFEG